MTTAEAEHRHPGHRRYGNGGTAEDTGHCGGERQRLPTIHRHHYPHLLAAEEVIDQSGARNGAPAAILCLALTSATRGAVPAVASVVTSRMRRLRAVGITVVVGPLSRVARRAMCGRRRPRRLYRHARVLAGRHRHARGDHGRRDSGRAGTGVGRRRLRGRLGTQGQHAARCRANSRGRRRRRRVAHDQAGFDRLKRSNSINGMRSERTAPHGESSTRDQEQHRDTACRDNRSLVIHLTASRHQTANVFSADNRDGRTSAEPESG